MWSRRAFGVSLLAAGLVSGCVDSTRPTPLVPTARAAAIQALRDLQGFAVTQDYRAVGFASPDEARRSQLGDPLTISEIGVERLRAYSPGAPVDDLLTPSPQTLYPVTVNGAVKSSVTIVRERDAFRPSAFGGPALIGPLSAYRQYVGGVSDTVVRVPALNLVFLARRRAAGLMLVPVFAEPDIGLPVGRETPAASAAERMSRLVQDYDGLPG